MTAYMSEKSADYQRNAFVVSGWKGMPIENFELRNAKVVFEGKMQPGALDRVDLPEYLDYSFMYADVFSVNGDYPASGLFMRHIDGAKIENCSFVRRDDDPRPLMMIYDVKNLRMRDVSGENGADMISAIDADLLLENCLHNGAAYGAATPFSAENTEKYRAFVTLSDETSAMFDKMAAQVDEAQNMENITSIPEDAWTQEGDRCYANIRAEGEKVMLLFSSYGDGELFVNGKSAAVCCVPRLYRNMIAWAADVTALLHEGDNLVEIRWDDPADMGGADCLLPFGVFKPYRVGLTKEAQICVK